MKQGCPLSPTQFNICIEPLLQRLTRAASEDGYHIADEGIAVLAYADDILLLSDSEQGMERLLRTTEEFCQYAKLTVNPKKCRSLSYIVERRRRTMASTIFKIADEPIPSVSLLDTTQYLGAAIGVLGTKRMRTKIKLLEKAEEDVALIATSCLKDNQVIDAIRRFILPRMEYAMMSGTCPKKKIKQLDTRIRGIIDHRLKATGLPVDLFYSNWRDGGLSLPRLEERQAELTLDTYVRIYDSSDGQTRNIFRHCVADEMAMRGLERDESSTNLNIKITDDGTPRSRGTHNLLPRAMKAMKFLQIRLYRREHKVMLRLTEDEEAEEISVGRNLLPKLNSMLRDRHAAGLRECPLKGHTFKTLKSNPISNFFIDWRSKISSALIRFAWRARTNSLMTGEIMRIAGHGDGRCQTCGREETLLHRLNGCPRKRHLYKPRHDAIVNILVETISSSAGRNNRRALHLDATVRGPQGERLEEEALRNLKPDIWYYEGDTLKLVEVTVPYGSTTTIQGQEVTTLQARRNDKLTKYGPLVEAARAQFERNVELYVITVSSLGAIPEETMRDLRRLVLANAPRAAKKMVFAAIKGSRDVYLNKTRTRRQGEEEEEREAQPPGETETSETEEDDPWLPEGTLTEEEIGSKPEDDEDMPEEGSDEEFTSEEDPATPWWNGEAQNPGPLEGENERGRVHDALDALFGLEVRPRPMETGAPAKGKESLPEDETPATEW